MLLTPDNYHGFEANQTFCSVSQYKRWLECPAGWFAEYRLGQFAQPAKDVFVDGEVLHVFALEPVRAPAVVAKYEDKLTPGRLAKIQAMARRVLTMPAHMKYLTGEIEQIYMGRIGGVRWKIKVDVVSWLEGFFTDLKSSKSLQKTEWIESKSKRGSFIELYNYPLQLAIYQEVLYQQDTTLEALTPYLIGVSAGTKNRPTPCVERFKFEKPRAFSEILSTVQHNMTDFAEQQSGDGTGLRRCEREECEYCTQTAEDFETVLLDESEY